MREGRKQSKNTVQSVLPSKTPAPKTKNAVTLDESDAKTAQEDNLQSALQAPPFFHNLKSTFNLKPSKLKHSIKTQNPKISEIEDEDGDIIESIPFYFLDVRENP